MFAELHKPWEEFKGNIQGQVSPETETFQAKKKKKKGLGKKMHVIFN